MLNSKIKMIQEPIYINILDKWNFFEQESSNYCLVAAIQETIAYLTNKKVEQKDIAFVCEWDSEGVKPLNSLIAINIILDSLNYKNKFYLTRIPKNYANDKENKINDLNSFQFFITAALKKNSPTILIVKGKLPWTEDNVSHAISIIGIKTVDNDSSKTIYTVSETQFSGVIHSFEGKHLSDMFTIDNGYFLSLNNSNDVFWIDETGRLQIDTVLMEKLIQMQKNFSNC